MFTKSIIKITKKSQNYKSIKSCIWSCVAIQYSAYSIISDGFEETIVIAYNEVVIAELNRAFESRKK